ncbi:MAG: Flp family type IVb pilin [Actinobacteria bacterium]|nr:Flp family type IVb pilin [Actinomycetota bacterium]
MRARMGTGERGSAVVEYALLVALLAVVCILAIEFLGQATNGRLSDVGSSLSTL